MSSTIRLTLEPRCGFVVLDSVVYPAVAIVRVNTSLAVPLPGGSNKPGDDMGVIRMLLMELATLRFLIVAVLFSPVADDDADEIGSLGDCRRFTSLGLHLAVVEVFVAAAGFEMVIFGFCFVSLLSFSLVLLGGVATFFFVIGDLDLLEIAGLEGFVAFGLGRTEATFLVALSVSIGIVLVVLVVVVLSFLGSFVSSSSFGEDIVALNLPPNESLIRFL